MCLLGLSLQEMKTACLLCSEKASRDFTLTVRTAESVVFSSNTAHAALLQQQRNEDARAPSENKEAENDAAAAAGRRSQIAALSICFPNNDVRYGATASSSSLRVYSSRLLRQFCFLCFPFCSFNWCARKT
jgi:hypothetical protein